MKKNNNKESSGVSAGAAVAIGAGVLALAAGSYYFFGPEGKKNRGKLKGWMIKMKGEVIEKMESAKDLSEAMYEKIVDSVAAKYAKAGKITEAEIRLFADSLKRQWKGISRSATPKRGGAKKTAAKKAAPKKAAKKQGK
jgi:hypothetical protein